MSKKTLAGKITKSLFDKDAFSQWLGIQIIDSDEGASVLSLEVREEMLNGFAIAHGGISYSLADSALAFASNSHGPLALSIETSISHLAKVKAGDRLRAIAREESRSRKIGIYRVEIKNQDDLLVALFKGLVYYKTEEHNF